MGNKVRFFNVQGLSYMKTSDFYDFSNRLHIIELRKLRQELRFVRKMTLKKEQKTKYQEYFIEQLSYMMAIVNQGIKKHNSNAEADNGQKPC